MEDMYTRVFDPQSLIEKNSFFLFGPRGTGKSTLVRGLKAALYYDLLEPGTFLRLLERPTLLEEELAHAPSGQVVILDEIQKLPGLLDSVQRLIENQKLKFILTGSSARKLKRQSDSNLLGGRVWQAHLYPLTYREINDFDLTRYLNRGGIPKVYQSKYFLEDLRAYVGIYLKEEVLAESLVRKLDQFSRFLEVTALQSGEELSLEGIASDSQVKAKTVGNYIEILEDTLIGFRLQSFWKTKKRKAISRSKFYLFDLGVTNYLARRRDLLPGSELFGKAFEQFIVLEVRAYISYLRKDLELFYWRSVHHQEVDLIVQDLLAIEIKATTAVQEKHLNGLKALQEEELIQSYIVVSQDPKMRKLDGFTVYPWQEFLNLLWGGHWF
jgi:hypothetical protein